MDNLDKLQRTVLAIPDPPRTGLICYDAKDPESKYPTITPLRPPAGAPNIVLVLIDDAGFGSSSAFGGPCNTPTAELLASEGRKSTDFIPLRSARPLDRLCYRTQPPHGRHGWDYRNRQWVSRL